MRPHDRLKNKRVASKEYQILRVRGMIEIDIPSQFYWPFPMWPLNRVRPFRRDRAVTGDVPRC